jgi:hypothetical protein
MPPYLLGAKGLQRDLRPHVSKELTPATDPLPLRAFPGMFSRTSIPVRSRTADERKRRDPKKRCIHAGVEATIYEVHEFIALAFL